MLLRCAHIAHYTFHSVPSLSPQNCFLYVFLIIASERSRMAHLTFWCPSGNNAVNHLWPLLFQADICPKVSHWLSGLGLLPSPPPPHTPQVGIRTGRTVWNPRQLRFFDFLLEVMLSSGSIWKAVEGAGFKDQIVLSSNPDLLL